MNTVVEQPGTSAEIIFKNEIPGELKLCLPTSKGFIIVKLDDIIYCEAQRSYTHFRFIDNRTMVIPKPLFEYDKILSAGLFCRIHKSYLVNLMHVKEYLKGEGGYVIMAGGKQIEVSRRKKNDFLNKIKECFKF